MSQPVVNAPRIPQDTQNSHETSLNDHDPSNPLSGRVSEIDSQGIFLLTSTVSIIMCVAVGFFCQRPVISILCSLMGCVNAIVHDRSKIQKKYNDVFPAQNASLAKASLERITTLEKEIEKLTEDCSFKEKELTRVKGWHENLSHRVAEQDTTIARITKERDEALTKAKTATDKSNELQSENDRLKTERAAIAQLDEKLKLISLEEKMTRATKAFENLQGDLVAMNQEAEQKKQMLLTLDEAIAERQKSK